jgi:hypothetical protein
MAMVGGLTSASVDAQGVPSVPAAPVLPSECSARRDSTAWNSGRSSGESRVNSVWRSSAVNRDLDNLSDALPNVLDALQQYLLSLAGDSEPTTNIKCRAQGYTEGFLFALNKLFAACVLDGADWGQFAADVYCRMSLELGGLGEETLFVRAPVGLCGNLFEYTCEDVYRYVGSEGDHTVASIVQDYLDDEGITLEPYPGCGIYTDDEYLATFEAALHNDCTYEIAE